MSLALEFRTATLDDLHSLLALQSASLLGLTASDYPAGLVAQFLRDMDMITPELLSEGHFFIGEDAAGRFLVCGGWSQAEPGYAHGFEDHGAPLASDEAIVRSMFVRPDCARQGLGRRMMHFIEEDARAHGIVRMTLSATRTGLPLYRACGYGNERVTELALSDGSRIKGIDMEKTLSCAPHAFEGAISAGTQATCD